MNNTINTFRSPAIYKTACVVSEEPLASRIGYDILQKGGNAADAAVAMSFGLGFLSPLLAGLGGDCNILYYKASDHSVHFINGSGKSAKALTLQKVKSAGFSIENFRDLLHLDLTLGDSQHGIFVTVPGFVMGINQLLKKFGSKKFSIEDLANPTIRMAENGAPLAKETALKMQDPTYDLRFRANVEDLLGTDSPKPGYLIRSPKLASCLKRIATQGPRAFYCGEIAENIVKSVQTTGGALTLEDMEDFCNSVYENDDDGRQNAVYKDFRGFRVWEMPPNTIGIIALHALQLLQEIDLKSNQLQ